MTELSISKIHKSFGEVDVLKGIDLTIKSGEFIVLLGPSGCGKSTLLRIIAGLEAQSSGDICLDTESVTHLAPAKRSIAMVFQSYALYPHLTVRGNMALVLKQAGLSKSQIQSSVAESSRALGLDPLLERKPSELSGGQRQRVAIGRAIVRDPKVFLFDEPLSNLDASLRGQVRLEIAALHQRLKATMVYVTHDQIEAMTLADRIVVMHQGTVQQCGSPRELYEQPANLFVAGFIGTPKMNLINIDTIIDRQAHLSPTMQLNLPENINESVTKVTLGIRPNDCKIQQKGDNCLEASVEIAEYLGDVTYVHAKINNNTRIIVATGTDTDYQVGDTIYIKMIEKFIHWFDSKTTQRL